MWRTFSIILCLATAGCATTAGNGDIDESRLTVGVVQKEIRVGMSGGEVAEVLGSPNIVSTGEDRNENWIYDKVATRVVRNDVKLGILGLSFSNNFAGSSSVSSSSRVSTQRTLTIIIKFDGDGLVRDYAYHASKF